MIQNEKTLSVEYIYSGKVVELTKEQIEMDNGHKSMRELIHHPGGVCVIPIDDEGNIYCVKQFRYPFKKVLLEVPAGKLEKGEDHRECGIRELKEEIGAEAKTVEYLGCVYPTVAYDNEIIHIYMAKGLTFGEQHLDEGEFVDIVKIPLKKAVEMVMNNEIPDSKSQIAILKAAYLEGNHKA